MPRKIFERQLAEVEDDITSICERVVYIVPRHDGRTQRSEALKQLDITVVGAWSARWRGEAALSRQLVVKVLK